MNSDSAIQPESQSTFRFMSDIPAIERRFNVGIIGATGAVGQTLIKILHERRFPVGDLHLYASADSGGKWVDTPFGQVCIEVLNEKKPPHLDLAFTAAGAGVSRKWGWRLAHRGAVVIDKSSYFRLKAYTPLIVPEVNEDQIDLHRGIIANPNCTTIPLVMALAPLHRKFNLRKVVAVSFQSVSGQGRSGMDALERELENPEASPSTFPDRIAFNAIPWIGSIDGGKSGEEVKLIRETRRILSIPKLPVRVTAVRIPTRISHAIAVHADFSRSFRESEIREVLSESPGIEVVDDVERLVFPTPLSAAGSDLTFIGRIRQDRGSKGLAFWVVADNLRKGAATNAVQIAEALITRETAKHQ